MLNSNFLGKYSQCTNYHLKDETSNLKSFANRPIMEKISIERVIWPMKNEGKSIYRDYGYY